MVIHIDLYSLGRVALSVKALQVELEGSWFKPHKVCSDFWVEIVKMQ